MPWFEASKEGLAKQVAWRNRRFALYELIQNALDTNAENVSISFKKLAGKPQAVMAVEDDDPSGFEDLRHAFVIFGESPKKADPTKRGWMDLGEKLALSICREATIETTKGTILFKADGTRERKRKKREVGTKVELLIWCNNKQAADIREGFGLLIPPDEKRVLFNGEEVPRRKCVGSFDVSLPTLIANDEGAMVKRVRKTSVHVYEPIDDEDTWLYEMGIPVVKTGDRFHIDVQQRVPVNMSRDNVSPTYLRKLRAAVLNETFDLLSEDDATEKWVDQALEDKSVTGDAVLAAIELRHGKNRAVFDISDQEANRRLTGKGFEVVHGSSYSRDAWKNIRAAGALPPSGKLSPTPKPYSDDPDAEEVETIPRSEWSDGMERVATLVSDLGRMIFDRELRTVMVKRMMGGCVAAMCGFDEVHFNMKALGRKWFDMEKNLGQIVDTVIHELAHIRASNHLDDKFYRELSRIASECVMIALEEPEVFRP